QIKTVENDGYQAIQLGFGDIKLKVQNGSGKGQRVRSEKFKNDPVNISKPLLGHFKKSDIAPKRTLREFRVENLDAYKVGDIVKADTFAAGDKIDVTGTSKGKGYAGVIKRWNFHRLKETHGSGPVARHGGS
ncbi:MAG TPA: 50S ribosomal protein L3, partial [Ruminococcaceae bacterium]|nr:50S ribosomal protein L3 [Oscillospiraceae bacterium]